MANSKKIDSETIETTEEPVVRFETKTKLLKRKAALEAALATVNAKLEILK